MRVTWVDAIRAMCSTLDKHGPGRAGPHGLGQDAVAYVLDGTDPGVLQRLPRVGFVTLTLHGGYPDGEHPARGLYDHFTAVPSDVLIRWATVQDHSLRSTNRISVDGASWPGVLLSHVGLAYPDGELPFDFRDFARLLEGAGVSSAGFVVAAWTMRQRRRYDTYASEPALTRLRHYGRVVRLLRDRLAPLLVEGDVDHRLHAFEMLAPVDDDVLALYAEQIVAAATSGKAQFRSVATPLVHRAADASAVHLRSLALSGKPDQRRHALQLLWDTAADEQERTFARDTALNDRAASVRTVADGFTEVAPPEAVPVPDVAEPDPIDWAIGWTPELSALVAAHVEEARWWRAADRLQAERVYTPDEVIEILREQLVSPDPVAEATFYQFSQRTSVADGIAGGLLTTPAVIKLLMSEKLLHDGYNGFSELRWAAGLLHEHTGLTLLELDHHLAEVPGIDAVGMLAEAWFAPASAFDEDRMPAASRPLHAWEPDALWPFFARHLDAVLAYWHERRGGHSYGFDSELLFPLVASFPETPTRLVELCYELALGPTKGDQRAAQDYLSTHPDAVRRASAALAHGNGTVRAVAAEWLGRLGDRSAVPDLAAAFTTERNETVQGTVLEALVALGEPVEAHFALASLDVQAEKALSKGLPAALTWLDPDLLPEVRRVGGASVPRATMLWLTVRAVAAKSSIPSALLRACAGQLDPVSAEAYADRLMALWLAADEADPGGVPWYLRGVERETRRSPGANARGLLALVAACGGRDSVAAAARFVRSWHGQRATVSKALLGMLAHHRDPGAAAELVAIAYRFKAPSIERTARDEVTALAERLGWTTDELSDRAVGTAGFDGGGLLELSYGARGFTARLLPDCTIELTDAGGKVLKSLPAPRQSDDEEAAREAKKTLSGARKELASTVKAQTTRLHDAMHSQRTWSGEAWREDLAGHPVLGRLAGQLVWLARSGDLRLTFRLLDDGTLTDVDDESVDLPDGAEVTIAHDVNLTDDEIDGWQQHLSDYEVPNLFSQLGRGRGDLSEEDATATSMVREATVPTGRLGQVTARLGYRRGTVGDAAAFDWFEKEFAPLGLTARILLAVGIVINDYQADTTVTGLTVVETATGRDVPLGELPEVLLVELRHDLTVVATP